ncbi:hypothetical protein NP493_246g03037 [Ridgeia piscesae]|uniref:Uncharacterized protein n=1 Tax=Ridgeia piscesae TaxID=27915 RepID=A0AAD9UD86_RIDPI|nr:hypothetical protein NP493_246g03037 [Ridgeia piscesae]
MAPPPHARPRKRSSGLIRDLLATVVEESKEKGREYYEEEMEWVQQPDHSHVKKRHPHDDKKHPHGVAERITKIYNAVEDSSKQKGLDYFEEETSWPIHSSTH